MSIQFARFKPAFRAAALALTLATAGFAAAPAQAQSFSFRLEIPGGQGMTFGGQGYDWHADTEARTFPRYRCLSNRDVVRGISRYGFRDVEIHREYRRDRVEVSGIRDGWLFGMRVDKCTGEVDRVERIRRAHRDWNDWDDRRHDGWDRRDRDRHDGGWRDGY